MCVPASQKPIQSLNDLPPPPGALGADSLGLPGDSAKPPLCLGTPPPDNTFDGCCGDSGDMPGTCGAGVPIADEGGAVGVLGAWIGGIVTGRAAPPVERCATALSI